MRSRSLCFLGALLAVACVSLVGCVPGQEPTGRVDVPTVIAAPASVTLVDDKALYGTELLLNRIAAVAKVVAPALPRAERERRADQLERAWSLLLDARCIHKTANGLPIRKSEVTRCGRAVLIHGADYRPVLAQASAIARQLQLVFGVK